MTLEELKSYIASNVNEVDLIEILGLTSEDICNHCADLIEDKFDKIIYDLELDKEQYNEEG